MTPTDTPQKNDFSPQNWSAIFDFLVFTTLFFLLYFYFKTRGPILDSDTLMPEHLYRDIFKEGGNLADWSFPGALYPLDFLLYTIIRHATQNIQDCFTIFATIQSCSLCLASYLIRPKPRTHLLVNAIGTIIVATSFQYLSVPIFHTLTYILSIPLLFRLCHHSNHTMHGIDFITLSLLIFSDKFTLIYVVAPYTLAALHSLMKQKNFRFFAANILYTGAAIILGYALDYWIRPGEPPMTVSGASFSKIALQTPHMFSSMLTFFLSKPFFSLAWIPGFIALIYVAIRQTSTPLIAFTLSIPLNFTLVAATHYSGIHYLLAAYCTPIIIGLPLVASALTPQLQYTYLTITLALFPYQSSKTHDIDTALACIEANLVSTRNKNGLAGYWTARHYTETSTIGLRLSPLLGVTNTIDYKVNTQRNLAQDTHFILKDLPTGTTDINDSTMLYNTEIIDSINGPPTEVTTCNDKELRRYHHLTIPTIPLLLTKGHILTGNLVPAPSALWEGNYPLTETTQLKGIYSNWLGYDHYFYVIINFTNPIPYDDKIQLAVTGLGAPKHRIHYAQKLSPTGNEPLDLIWRAFMEKRTISISPRNTARYNATDTIIYFKAPNRNLTEVSIIEFTYNNTIHRIK